MESGNSKHRMSYSGGVKAQEEQKWGRAKAEERYGPLKTPDMRAPDRSKVEACGDAWNAGVPGKGWQDDHPQDWVRGFGKNGRETAETKPGFDARGKDGRPKKW